MNDKIRRLWNYLFKHELLAGSIYIISGSMIGNIFIFFFSLFMGRNLTVEGFGILSSAVSLITLTTIPAGAITPTIVSFAGPHFAKGDYGSIKALFLRITKPLLIISVFLFLCFFIFAGHIGSFFKITDKSLMIIVGIVVASTYIGTMSIGLLQAKLAFKFISFSNLLGNISKFVFGAGLVSLGFAVRGAMWAIFISGLIPPVLGFIYLKSVFASKLNREDKIPFKDIISYGIPSSLAMLGMTSLISADILLVKHFFDPLHAGIYAGLSLVGKIIFFLTAPIGSVMFSLIVKKHAKNEDYTNIFKMAVALVIIPSVLISIFYFLYPEFSISFVVKNEIYKSAANLLGLYGIFIAIYSLISLFVYYFLSIKRTKVYLPVISAAAIQLLLIFLYHNSLFVVVLISLLVASALLMVLVVYYIEIYGKYKKINHKQSVVEPVGGISY